MCCARPPPRSPGLTGMSPSGDARLSGVPQHGLPLGGRLPAPELGRQECPAWQEGGQPLFFWGGGGRGGECVVFLTTRTPQHRCDWVSHHHLPCVLAPSDATGHADYQERARRAAVLCAGTTPWDGAMPQWMVVTHPAHVHPRGGSLLGQSSRSSPLPAAHPAAPQVPLPDRLEVSRAPLGP